MTTAERAARLMLGSLDEPEREIGSLFSDLFERKEMLSDGEQIVAELGLAFWNGAGTATLADALRWLDRENLVNLVHALEIVRPDVMDAARAHA